MDQPTWIGRTLSGRYKIEELLGQGGMSAVYKATDPNLKRVVAIKLIHQHLSTDPSFVLRFESEAAAVASLRHPNIVQVYDFNNDNGIYYMVLEFIPGETLQDRLKRLVQDKRKLPPEDAIRFTVNIADAVGYAHQRGMVHRDIKPANIMLDIHGQGILMDFGIVKILGGESHTSTGAVVGTARYMSPESIRGEVADHRSDIYSLGVTFYEMLSGRPPFVADSAMTLMMMHLNDPIPDIREFRSDIPSEVIAVLEKCMAKNREDRYQSAAELSRDLKRALGSLGGQATSVGIKKQSVTDEKTELQPVPPAAASKPDLPSATVAQSVPPTSPPPVPIPEASSPAQPKPSSRRNLYFAGGAILLFLCCVGGFFAARANGLLAGRTPTETPTSPPTATFTLPPTEPVILAPTATSIPLETPTETVVPYTPTPDKPYVVITGITLENGKYVVNYEVHNFPTSPQLHVHMFFDTVPPDQAGVPGSGPWKLTWGPYGDPPFTKYGVADRPPGAMQMCSLVANSNHTVQPNSGNCVDLPQ